MLLINLDCKLKGTIDEQGLITFSDNDEDDTYDLIDEIAKRAMATGARVLAVHSDDLPYGTDLNAILRFPL
ncbi:hypothetical protein [Serratia fonticola]|uniref:hypothetical protein n=1 Tax=Serratia fonticola TaxID=47917 RepID=UPI0021AE126D|nr:hypothetical protein [Serratia fonticola]